MKGSNSHQISLHLNDFKNALKTGRINIPSLLRLLSYFAVNLMQFKLSDGPWQAKSLFPLKSADFKEE